jgi:amino acid permease
MECLSRMMLKRRAFLGARPRGLILFHPLGLTKQNYITRYIKLIVYFFYFYTSEFIPKDAFNDLSDIDLWLKVNDKTRQQGNTKDMIFK